MVRTTRYTKRLAERGNARIVQGTMETAPTVHQGPVQDHAHRTRSSRELRHLPVVVCSACLATMTEWPVFTVCRDAACEDGASTCENCGTARPLPAIRMRDTQRVWGR